MKQTVHTTKEAMEFLRELGEFLRINNKNLKVGIAGSFARGEQTSSSDLDIVLDTYDDTVFSLQAHIAVDEYCSKHLAVPYDILWIKDLEEQDKVYDNLLMDNGLAINTGSAYKNIVRETRWADLEP
ncbi:MAG: nucleotidyltransferase domain-containing protein [Enterocloster asparagiformis]|nr:nucleotidyltransferase domain-containing protein [Enterocloster asparagiformis]